MYGATNISVLTLQVADKIGIVGRPSGTGLPDEQRAALSRVLRAIQIRDFASVSAMAKAWDMEQSYLNQVINGTAGAGMSFLLQTREKSGLSLDTLLGLDLLPSHLVRDAEVRELTVKLPAVESQTKTLAEDFERIGPVKTIQPAQSTPKLRQRARSRDT